MKSFCDLNLSETFFKDEMMKNQNMFAEIALKRNVNLIAISYGNKEISVSLFEDFISCEAVSG